MGTCFQILLGKFEIQTILTANPFLGGLLFISFNLSMLLIVLNLIITTISDTFSKIKANEEDYFDSSDVTGYMAERLEQLYDDFKKGELIKKKIFYEEDHDKPDCYVGDNARIFKMNTEKLVNRLNLVKYKKIH